MALEELLALLTAAPLLTGGDVQFSRDIFEAGFHFADGIG